MTPRTRRLVGALVITVILLFIARWSVAFVAERWWAFTISSDAAAFVTRWQLIGFALDAAAVGLASLWFALQALLVARAIASVQVAHRLGNLHLREAVPTRILLGGAVASGVLLGLIAGTGANSWRNSLLLAWHGVHYGVTDPLLDLDVGVLIGQLPAWDLLHRFAVLLAVVGLAFCVALYSGIGALRRDHGAISVHPDARRHLGMLLAVVAAVVAAGYLLEPYHLATAALQPLTTGGVPGRARAAEVMAGVAGATGLLSVWWAFRGRNATIAAAWIVLAVGALFERYGVQALAEEVAPRAATTISARQFDSLAWGIRGDAPPVTSETIPAVTAIWDHPLLARAVERDGSVLEAATPRRLIAADGRSVPAWLIASSPPTDSAVMEIMAIADGAVGSGGTPVLLPGAGETPPGEAIWRSVPNARVRPLRSEWQSVSGAVNASSPLRRLLLAWARQAPGMLGEQPHDGMDWHLDPVERAAAILPIFSWSSPDLAILDSRPTWLLQGLLPIPAFPLTTRARWREGRVAGVVPAVICTIDAATGELHFYLDPAADSLGVAWGRVVGPLIGPASAIPAELRAQIGYPVEWFSAQLAVLGSAAWSSARPAQAMVNAAPPAPIWMPGTIPGHQALLSESSGPAATLIVTAFRTAGIPELQVDRRDIATGSRPDRAGSDQRWSREAAMMHLRDSVTAAGDTVWARAIRWSPGDQSSWQPIFALPRRGPPALLWIATELGDQMAGGRTPAEAWHAVTEPDRIAAAHVSSDAATLDLSREWLQRADSALRRGDMTAFGRAFEELRRALIRRP